jgi:hypothetical protein
MAKELADVCTMMVRHGEDFPTVWTTYLKGHALVIGLPESKLECRRPVLEIKAGDGRTARFRRRCATLSRQVSGGRIGARTPIAQRLPRIAPHARMRTPKLMRHKNVRRGAAQEICEFLNQRVAVAPLGP